MKPRTAEKGKLPTMRNQHSHLPRRTGRLAGAALSVCALTALVYLYGSASATAGQPSIHAYASKTISLNETGHLHLTSKHNFTLNEQGTASGTASGTIYVHLTAVSNTRVTVEVNIYPKGGSITGSGSASYRKTSGAAEFSGSMTIDRGTGTYAHIHGSGLSFNGTVAESNKDAITVHVSGRVSD
jgi:hypothetical protein